MGACTSKPPKPNPYAPRGHAENALATPSDLPAVEDTPKSRPKLSPFFPFYTPSPSFFRHKDSPPDAVATPTPRRLFKKSFPPPSPAKHIRAVLRRSQQGKKKKANKNSSAVPPEGVDEEEEESEGAVEIDKRFGFSKEFVRRLEVGEVVGRGHFGYTCSAKFRKGERKGQRVAVKVIPKSKMAKAIAVEDVRREVKILRALTGHDNLVQFYDAFEDFDNVYIVMELCEGGELLDRILSRGGKYSEDDAKAVMVQILNIVAFCHLQGVVHRDLKPENFLYTTKDENSQLKAIDFGLSDFVRPDRKLNDIVGSAYYVAPEVLHRSYSTEADVWSVGVIGYILLCGGRPFWAHTESGIFRAVLKADPSFDEEPWPSISPEAKDFLKHLLNKDPRKRMTAAQALSHPWLRSYNGVKVPLDILIFRLMTAYMRSSSLRKAALRALSKTLTVDELFYLKEQFALLEPHENCTINLDNFRMSLVKNGTDAMKDSHIPDFLASVGTKLPITHIASHDCMPVDLFSICSYISISTPGQLNALQFRRMDFEEFCAAALSVHQLEALERWQQHACRAYELFENDGNRAIVIEELASELGLGPTVPVHAVLNDWVRHTDGKLSFHGFLKLLHGISRRGISKVQ